MKNIICKILLKLQYLLYQFQIRSHIKQMQYREESIKEIQRLIREGKGRLIPMTDPKTKTICYTFKQY